MNRFILVVMMVWMGAVAGHAAVEVELGGARPCRKAVFTFSSDGSAVTLKSGALQRATPLSENVLGGAVGLVTVEWSATHSADQVDASSWKFGEEGAEIDPKKVGWGVISLGDKDGDTQITKSEAVLLKFDVSGLTLDPGKCLVFSVRILDGDSCRIYRRAEQSVGKVVASMKSASSGYSRPVPVTGLLEFAITDAGYNKGQDLRIIGFSLDVANKSDVLVGKRQ
jgi:hypothetical protein